MLHNGSGSSATDYTQSWATTLAMSHETGRSDTKRRAKVNWIDMGIV